MHSALLCLFAIDNINWKIGHFFSPMINGTEPSFNNFINPFLGSFFAGSDVSVFSFSASFASSSSFESDL